MIVIEDFEMPGSCSDCCFVASQNQGNVNWYLCLIPKNNQPRLLGRGIPMSERDKDCPLIETQTEQFLAYIRHKLMEAIVDRVVKGEEAEDDDDLRVSVGVVKQNILAMPTIEAEPRKHGKRKVVNIRSYHGSLYAPIKHGRWIHRYGDGHTENAITGGECSLCGFVNTVTNYCPNCGAKMDEVTE